MECINASCYDENAQQISSGTPVRDSVYDTVEVGVNDANDQIAKL